MKANGLCSGVALAALLGAGSASAITINDPGYAVRLVGDLPGSSNFYGGVAEYGGEVFATGALSGSVIRIDAGGLATVFTSPGSSCCALGVAAADGMVYHGDNRGSLWQTPIAGGGSSLVALLGTQVSDIALAPDAFGAFGGMLVVGGHGRVDVVDSLSGSVSTLATITGGGLYDTITVDFTPDGRLLATSLDTGQVLEIGADGSVSVFASGLRGPSGIAVDPASGEVFVASEHERVLYRFAADGTGLPLFSSNFPIDGGYYPTALSFTSDGTSLLFSQSPSQVWAIDGFAGVPAAVTEPAPLALLAFGGVALGVARRVACTQRAAREIAAV